jgi:hypothetical protein
MMQKLRALAVVLLAGLTLYYAVFWLHDLVAGWWLSALKGTAAVFAAGAGTDALFGRWHTEHLRSREEVRTVQPLTVDAEGQVQPGRDESWEELAEHSLTRDDLPRTGTE